MTTVTSTPATRTVQCPASRWKRRRREMLVAVGLLLLLRVDEGHGLPRAWSSSSRVDETTRGDDVITDTESGRVRGIRHRGPHLRRHVDAYLGIPFAKPPLNSLRFRHPQPIEKWRNIYNATRLPNSCYQLHDTVFGTDFHVNNLRTYITSLYKQIKKKLSSILLMYRVFTINISHAPQVSIYIINPTLVPFLDLLTLTWCGRRHVFRPFMSLCVRLSVRPERC